MSRERQTLLLADGLQLATLAVALIFIASVLSGCSSRPKLGPLLLSPDLAYASAISKF